MKKILFLGMLVGLSCSYTACRKSNASRTSTTQTQEASLSEILKAGPWIIDYYFDEEDKSTDLTGYVFTFSADGGVSLKKGDEFYRGQWQVLTEDEVTKLYINLNTINVIQKLNDKWELKTINSTKLEMKNDNPARSEFLTIKRV